MHHPPNTSYPKTPVAAGSEPSANSWKHFVRPMIAPAYKYICKRIAYVPLSEETLVYCIEQIREVCWPQAKEVDFMEVVRYATLYVVACSAVNQDFPTASHQQLVHAFQRLLWNDRMLLKKLFLDDEFNWEQHEEYKITINRSLSPPLEYEVALFRFYEAVGGR